MPKFAGCSILLMLVALYGCQTHVMHNENILDDVDEVAVVPCSDQAADACQELPQQYEPDKVTKTYQDAKGCTYTEYENGLADAACPQ